MNRNDWLTQIVKHQLGDIEHAVEVGVWRGDYSATIISRLKPKYFHGVDPYLLHDDYNDAPDPVEFANQNNLDALWLNVHRRFALMGHTLHRMKGVDAAELFEDNTVDFVYIDGDHSYEFVSKDIAAWWPKLRSGGILSGHDYTPGNPSKNHIYGVIEAVDEHAQAHNKTVSTTNEQYATWWITK